MRKYLAIMFLLLGTLFAVSTGKQAYSQGGNKEKFEGLLNKLLAPGPLVLGHDELEHKDCLKCHDPGGGVPNKNCLDCHKKINEQIVAKQHFHGLMTGKNCIDCHKEHKGREANLTGFDKNSFDHSRTGFKLDGAHAKAECKGCHTDTRKDKPTRKLETEFFGMPVPTCIGCHKKDDIHFFEGKFKSKQCSECHTTESWKGPKKFDHLQQTGYALEGAHGKLVCSKCHVSEGKNNIKYDFPRLKSEKCLACHKDQHQNNFDAKFQGPQCLTCHTQTEWKITNFKHDVTGFTLVGAHSKLQCISCHKSGNQGKELENFNFKGVQKDCKSCHADYHGYGKEIADKMPGPLANCVMCHAESAPAWKPDFKFDHNSQTRFPITGKHKQNVCFDCHKPTAGPAFKNKPNTLRKYNFPTIQTKTCENCHKSPHPAAFQKRFNGVPCASCHVTDGWNIQNLNGQILGDKSFHSKTRFPLTGSHQKLNCKTCHNVKGQEVYQFPNAEKNFCVTCHATPHKGQFTEATVDKPCSTCHTTEKFEKRLPFDHDANTDFKLIGKHKTIETSCNKCHVATNQKLPTKPPKVAHLFKFSRDKDPNLCKNCHVNVHQKQFEEDFQKKSCAACHTPNGFDKLNDFNHDQTAFKITGAHVKVKNSCNECHKPSNDIVLATKPPKRGHQFIFPGEKTGFCENCHVNEHKNMFEAKFYNKPCVTCHTVDTFDKRKSFDHSQTSFELKGKHQKVKCAECHTPTKERFTEGKKDFKGKYNFPDIPAKNCAACHRDPHNGANGTQCTKCHTEAGWKSAGDFHKDMELIGVHLQIDCKSCHSAGRILKGSSQECTVCHIKDDNHNGQLPQCGECHLQNFWTQTTFDHNLTRFPLQGAHRVTECRSCHNEGTYRGLPTECSSCHFRDANAVVAPDHKASARFLHCDRCHNTYSFPGAVAK